uniref:Uncharacterized protein n=1 Tax=Oryza meridionalis TaxID=40149 RepID=A0A0E0CAE0_9ORYZ
MEKNTAATGQLMTSFATATPSSPKRPAGGPSSTRRGTRCSAGCGGVGARGAAVTVSGLARSTPPRRPRAHDAAILALFGASASLNFADSAWLLHIPRAPVVSGLRPPAARCAARRQQGCRRVPAPGEYRHCHCHLRR